MILAKLSGRWSASWLLVFPSPSHVIKAIDRNHGQKLGKHNPNCNGDILKIHEGFKIHVQIEFITSFKLLDSGKSDLKRKQGQRHWTKETGCTFKGIRCSKAVGQWAAPLRICSRALKRTMFVFHLTCADLPLNCRSWYLTSTKLKTCFFGGNFTKNFKFSIKTLKMFFTSPPEWI